MRVRTRNGLTFGRSANGSLHIRDAASAQAWFAVAVCGEPLAMRDGEVSAQTKDMCAQCLVMSDGMLSVVEDEGNDYPLTRYHGLSMIPE